MSNKHWVFRVAGPLFILLILTGGSICFAANLLKPLVLTPEERGFLNKTPRIVLGIDKKWEPAVKIDKDGGIDGLDKEMLDEINQRTGANFVLKPGVWKTLVSEAKNGEIDGLASSVRSPEREKYFNFSDPYYLYVPMALVLKKNPLNIRNWDDLNGKRIAVLKGVKLQESKALSLSNATIVYVDTLSETICALISDKADATFGFGAYFYMRQASKLGISKVQFAFSMTPRNVVYSIRKDRPLVLSILNKGLAGIPQAQKDQIFDKWYDASEKKQFNFILLLKVAIPLALVISILIAFYFRRMSGKLLQVQKELENDVAERKQAQKKLDWESRINKALADLGNSLISTDLSIEQIASNVLDTACFLTRSKYGYVSQIDRITHENKMYTFIDLPDALSEKPLLNQTMTLPRGKGKLYAGLRGYSLNTGEPFFTNDAAAHPVDENLPEDHVPLERFLSVPVKYGDQLIGQIFLAEPRHDYSNDHFNTVQRLADLYALALHRQHSLEDRLLIENHLQHARKMESLGTLAGGVAHDFNNLLSVIMGYSEMLLENDPELIQVPEAADEIFGAGKQARELVNQILTFSRKMDPVLEPVDLNRVIGDVKNMLDRTMPKMIKVTYDLADDTGLINADAGNMTQVFMNLCANAKDAMPEGGDIVIKTRKIFPDKAFLSRHGWARQKNYICLTVADTGIGMDQDIMDHIYDPFFTSKAFGKGTGLGLSSVYGIVQTHGGHIICDSEPGKGTRFKIYLPALGTGASLVEGASGVQGEKGGPVKGETILLVDDERLIRDIGKRILAVSGYQALEAGSGEDALQIYRERGNEIDLVILDINMPGMGGEKCLDELLSLDPDVKVIQASGYFRDSSNPGIADKVSAFLQKPFTVGKMAQTIRQVLDRTI